MATIGRFEDVQAWQKAREFVREVYKLRTDDRLSKDFGLRGQLCRAAVSSMSNIAEGFARVAIKILPISSTSQEARLWRCNRCSTSP